MGVSSQSLVCLLYSFLHMSRIHELRSSVVGFMVADSSIVGPFRLAYLSLSFGIITCKPL
jgi:DNA polymerase sigma